jgi:class 3 adenylate cyclase/TolB-like protein
MSDSNRRLAAFWFADIVGFTTLSARDEEAALEAVGALRTSATDEVRRGGGRVVKVSGDAVLAEFGSADASLRTALALRDALAGKVSLHVGVHLGDVTEDGGDIYGDGVNTAARLQAHAGADQIVVSEDIFRHLRSNRAYRFESIGELELKGLPAPLGAYRAELSKDGQSPRAAAPAPAVVPDAPVAPSAAPEPVPSSAQGATAVKRLIVAPFRLLRPDDEIDFLSFSLADAVSFSLSSLESLVVRSSHLAETAARGALDPRQVARLAEVDMVISGTLLRMGERLQVTAELTDGRDGTRLGSFRTHAGVADLFDLQEKLSGQIVDALGVRLTVQDEQRLSTRSVVPATARAYELYLRATELGHRAFDWATPRDMYLAALEEDPTYAPAWAHLGRCYWLLSKHDPSHRESNRDKAQAAFRKAVALDPELDLAHSHAAQLETDRGRSGDAMVRLLERLERRPRGVDLFVGLVQSLRYSGLLEESLAAHEAARAIDPAARTSVAFTHFMRGDFPRCLESGVATDFVIHSQALMTLGRAGEASALLRANESRMSPAAMTYMRPVWRMAEGHSDPGIEEVIGSLLDFPDPEGRFLFARMLAYLGKLELAFRALSSMVEEYSTLPPPGQDPWLASVDRDERYAKLLARVSARREENRRRFEAIRGGRAFS